LLEGGKAVVTGGASGIGRATARRMAEEGACVAVIDIDIEGAEQVAAEISGSAHAADVTDPEGLRAAIDAAAAEMGGITILFNNAGIGSSSPLADWTPEEWDRLVRVNLTGASSTTSIATRSPGSATPSRTHSLQPPNDRVLRDTETQATR
jgi:2-keto-3-deoxy-L-fuconate dehydrogenase